MKTKKFVAISVLLLVSLACGAIPQSQLGAESSDPNLPEISNNEEDLLNSGSSGVITSLCQREKWKILPTGSFEYGLENGWKLLIVQFAVKNGSNLWGTVFINPPVISVTTEDGFSSTGQIGTGYDQGQEYRYYFAFEIADSQKKPVVNISNAQVNCIAENGETVNETLPSVSYSTKDNSKLTFRSSEKFPDLGKQMLEIPNLGSIQFMSVSRDATSVVLKFQFKNAVQATKLRGILEVSSSAMTVSFARLIARLPNALAVGVSMLDQGKQLMLKDWVFQYLQM